MELLRQETRPQQLNQSITTESDRSASNLDGKRHFDEFEIIGLKLGIRAFNGMHFEEKYLTALFSAEKRWKTQKNSQLKNFESVLQNSGKTKNKESTEKADLTIDRINFLKRRQ